MFDRFNFHKRAMVAASVVMLAACLSGCVGGRLPEGSADELAVMTSQDYRFGPGDKLRIITFDHENLTNEFVVGSNGTISFPLLGDVQAAGLTAPQLQEELASSLTEGGYVVTPVVNVEVLEFRPFYILGEVNQPGAFPFSPGMTVANAVASAGGFTYRANERRVYIRRANSASETEVRLTATTPVFPGDTIRIGERIF